MIQILTQTCVPFPDPGGPNKTVRMPFVEGAKCLGSVADGGEGGAGSSVC
jgi:hypothetical protein